MRCRCSSLCLCLSVLRAGRGFGDAALSATNVFELDSQSSWRLVSHRATPIITAAQAASWSSEQLLEDEAVEYDADDFPGATG